MPRCEFCIKKNSLLFTCNYCNKKHCASCRYQEVHKCENLHVMKLSKQEMLKTELMNKKTEDVKIIKI